MVLDGSMFLHGECKPGQLLRNGLLAGADFGVWFLLVLVFTLIASLFLSTWRSRILSWAFRV